MTSVFQKETVNANTLKH